MQKRNILLIGALAGSFEVIKPIVQALPADLLILTLLFSLCGIMGSCRWPLVPFSRHGGAITVTSEEGKGSVFTFTLPVPK